MNVSKLLQKQNLDVLRYPFESFPMKIRSCLKKQCRKNGILGLKTRLLHYVRSKGIPTEKVIQSPMGINLEEK